jgi:TonB-dependent starch-binding outer membrane protein SusC
MKKLFFLCVTLILFTGVSLYGQSIRITGTITDATDGSTLPGVTVVVKGTSQGTTSDPDGNYEITADASAVLVFSFIGMQSKEEPINSRNIINVSLQPAVVGLDEVVIVAYGTQQKRNVIGSLSGVSSSDFEDIPLVSFESALQGRTPGLTMSSSSRAGEANAIRIRGTSSISASSQPLYVIDGVPQGDYIMGYTGNNAQMTPLSTIDPNDIESIQVLKDAAAAALYGSRASNGVILITTKRGKPNTLNINFTSQMGIQQATNILDVMSGPEYTEFMNEAYFYADSIENMLGNPANAIDTRWIDEVFRTGFMQDYSLSASGGSEQTQFYAALSLKDEEGYTLVNDFNRINARLNLDHKVGESFSFGGNMNFSRVFTNRQSNNNSVSSGSTSSFLQYPNIPIYGDGSGLYGPEGSYYLGRGVNPDNNIAYNLLHEYENTIHEAILTRPNVSFYAQLGFLEDFQFRSEAALDYVTMSDYVFWGKGTGNGGPGGVGQEIKGERINYIFTNTLNYRKSFGERHDFTMLLGHSFQETTQKNTNVTGRDFPDNRLNTLNSAANITNGGSAITGFALESYFSRFTYALDNRYLFEFSLRRDGSSRFGSNNRYANFPAAAFGWVINEEAFMSGTEDLFSILKLRASYGLTGNSEIMTEVAANAVTNNFIARGLYDAGNDYAGFPGIAHTQLENPDLRWEQTAQFNIGLDVGLFDERIYMVLDLYTKNTKDLLLTRLLPATSGFFTFTENVGDLENKGVEFSLNTRNIDGEFRWNTSFNIGANRNKIVNIDGQIITGGAISRAIEGEPIGVFWAPVYAGVDPENGDALFYDLDGNKTNVYSMNNAQIIGDPNPDFTGGLTNSFTWKGFDLSVFMQFAYGFDIYRDEGRFIMGNGYNIWNQCRSQLERWQKPGDITDVPQARLKTNGNQHSSRYIEDGSYARLKNVTLGYTLPQQVVQRMQMKNARVFIMANNWLTFTNYKGMDPEVTSQGVTNIGQGVTFFQAPTPKSIVLGININI